MALHTSYPSQTVQVLKSTHLPCLTHTLINIYQNPLGKQVNNFVKEKEEDTCIAMTSGSKLVTKLVNSGQLFLTRRRKLFAFQVKNLRGSFVVLSSDISPFSSLSILEGEIAGFLADPSFSTGWKNRFIVFLMLWGLTPRCVCSPFKKMFFFISHKPKFHVDSKI